MILDQQPPRFHCVSDATKFLQALDFDPSASPYDFGAVPPFTTEITTTGTFFRFNPEYKQARYELTYFIDKPEADKIKEAITPPPPHNVDFDQNPADLG